MCMHKFMLLSCTLTSFVVIPSVTPGRAGMQNTVIPSPTGGMDCETDGGCSRHALQGVSRKLAICDGVIN